MWYCDLDFEKSILGLENSICKGFRVGFLGIMDMELGNRMKMLVFLW